MVRGPTTRSWWRTPTAAPLRSHSLTAHAASMRTRQRRQGTGQCIGKRARRR